MLARLQLTATHRDLFGVRPRERDGRALRVNLFQERIDLRLRRRERGPRLIELLRRSDVLLREIQLPETLKAAIGWETAVISEVVVAANPSSSATVRWTVYLPG